MVNKLPPNAERVKNINVHISGFVGVHPIETGIAYWYRGHYLYTQAGTPLQPMPFATKKGIHIVGTPVDSAPLFHYHGPYVRYEYEVAALHRSMVHTWEQQQEAAKEDQAAIEASAFESQNEEIHGLVTGEDKNNPQALKLRRQGRMYLNIPGNDEAEAKYNSRAMFLAQSAPGSHHGTPAPSRPSTPPVGPFHAVASMSRMQTLLDQGPIIDSLHKLQENRPELLNPRAVNTYLSTMSHARSQSHHQSRLSRIPSGISFSMANTKPKPRGGSSRNASIHKDIPGPSMKELVMARKNKEAGAGNRRPRTDSMKAASIALNAAVVKKGGSVLKCPIHGGDCDGTTVTGEHLSLKHFQGSGFAEEYPMVTQGERTMVDWYALLKEERATLEKKETEE